MNPTRTTPTPHPTGRTITAAIRTIASGLGAAAVLAGLPYLLATRIGWPLPRRWMGIHALVTDLTTRSLNTTAVLNTLAVVLWICWAVLVVGALTELTAAILRRPAPQLPGLRPGQVLATALIALIGITLLRPAAPTAPHVSLPEPAHRAGNTATNTTTPAPDQAPQRSTSSGSAAGTRAESQDTATVSDTSTTSTKTITVRTGQTLSGIAETYTGNGSNWPALFHLNVDRAEPDGNRFTDPNLIKPGWRLEVPVQQLTNHTNTPTNTNAAAGSPNTNPTGRSPDATTPTSSAAATAKQHTPNAATTSGLPAAPNSPAPAPPQSTNSARGSEHADASPAPGSAEQRSARTSANSADWIELAEGGALAAAVLAALALALRRAGRRRRWHATCYWPVPGQKTDQPLTMPLPLHQALRHIAATGDSEQTELDEYGAPTDSVPNQVHQAPAQSEGLRGFTGHDPQPLPSPDPGQPAGNADDAGRPLPIAVAIADGQVLALQDLEPYIGLTGPGAVPAARAITAAIVSAAEHRPDGARLLISRANAALLLECPEADLPAGLAHLPDLELFDHGSDALAQLDQYIAHRTRLLEEHEVTRLEDVPDYDDDYFPPVVLVSVEGMDDTTRVSASVRAGDALRTHAIVIGEQTGNATWHVDTDGHATGPGMLQDAQMFHLSARALTAALAVLEEACHNAEGDQGAPIAPNPISELAAPEPATDGDQQSTLAAEDPAAGATPESADTPQTNNPSVEPAPVPERENSELQDTQAASTPQPDPAPSTTANTIADDVPAAEDVPGDPTPAEPEHGASGPHLLIAPAEPDRVEQITEAYASHPVRIKVLGVRAIITPTGTVDTRLRSDAWRAAMKLAVAGRYGQHLEDFAELWPDQDDPALRVTVKNAIYDLRKTLRQRCGDSASNPGRYVTQANRRYALNEQTVAVDLATFTELRSVAAQTRDIGERTAAARAALHLYDGELLAGEDEEWMIAPRTRTRRDALATATLLAQISDHAEDPDTALTWWERALQIDDNEEVYRQIITLQLRLHHHADALATCDLLRTRLDADGLAPTAETMAVLARARGRQPILTPSSPRKRHAA